MRLSRRETEIALLVADRWTDKEIAAHFGLSVHTIRRHLDRIAGRLYTESDTPPRRPCRRAISDWANADNAVRQ